MKRYRVGAHEAIGGFIDIDANSSKEAEEKAQKLLDDSSFFNSPDSKTTFGEREIFSVEIIT